MSVLRSTSDESAGELWTALNRFLCVLIALTFLAMVIYRYLPELGKQRQQEARVEMLKGQIAEQKQRLARRTLEENLLKRDPEYIGLIARDKLDLMKEGETIFRVEAPQIDASKMHLKH